MPRPVSQRWSEYLGPGAFVALAFAVVLAVAGLWVPVLLRLRQVVGAARRDQRAPADAILVVGRALRGNRATPAFLARLTHGAALFRAGLAPRIVVAGGLTGDATRSEAAVGREHLLALGVPESAILCEDRSRHTLENLYNVREAARAGDWRRLLAVSDPLHLARVVAFGRGLGLEIDASPARFQPRGWRFWAGALWEAHLLHWYHSGVTWSRLTRNPRYLARFT